MPIPYYQVDAFASRPFRGNPAAVCLLAEEMPAAWMQSVAAEINLAETAFVHVRQGGYALRWFTPQIEVNLCGHATLAAAHVLWEDGQVAAREPIRFTTNSGIITTQRVDDEIQMNFPAETPTLCTPQDTLNLALGAKPIETLRCQSDYLVVLQSEQAVQQLQPDFHALRTIVARGIMVTARSESPDTDFVSRFFAPRIGINEDSVTGSAHCVLTPYWSHKLAKQKLMARQLSARGGVLHLHLQHDRVMICGMARTIIKGTLYAK